MKIIQGGVTSPIGFKAAGAFIGLKKARKDLALLVSEKPAIYSGTFTTNVVKAAPVKWNMNLYKHEKEIKGIVINSGNANACTGVKGEEDTRTMAAVFGEAIGAPEDNILVCSTGVIGVQLPMDIVVEGIKNTAPTIGSSTDDGTSAAEAIMTTDTFKKEIAVELEIGGKPVRIGGMAKGSGMIHPNMATMLAFVTTDVNISFELLDKAVKEIVGDTYNMISVDGDTSTNDMLIVLSNKMAENDLLEEEHEDYLTFKKALYHVCEFLSKQIVLDGEGASKFIEVNIKGARSKKDARLLAKSIVTSNLVKTAFFGNDANWGRALCAMGYSGAMFDPMKVTLRYESTKGSIDLLVDGVPQKFDEDRALEIIKEKEVQVNVFLDEGTSKSSAWGCDLSYEYVKINGEYRT